MYLKRLELFGFKTFSQKTEIEFQKGFLAVVGPNGSGKSNLTDAIRFCLGEQSVKAMRATKLPELVFAGSPTRRGAPYAEVTAVFDNTDGTLPVELSEVAITRRLDPDGDSKFQINRTNCRLRDVHELLMGSGIGPGSFSVLGGKEVDQVLSSDPKERRLMLEETAGVNRYRFRKKEASRKLERTAANLTRLHDILREVEAQLEESKRQLSRYERYRQAQVELQDLDRTLIIHDWHRLDSQRAALQQRFDEAVAELEAVRGQEQSRIQQFEALQAEKSRLDAHREQQAAELSSLREQAGINRANYEAIFRRASELEHSARAAQARLASSQQRLTESTQEIQALLDQMPQAKALHEQARKGVEELQQELRAIPGAGQGPSAELRARLTSLEKEYSQSLNRREVIKGRLESDRQRLSELAGLREQLACELAEQQPAQDQSQTLKESLERSQKSVEEFQLARKQAEAQLELTRQERKQLEQRRRPVVSRVTELEALLEDRSGLPPAVRAVMSWKVSGTIGLIGELIQVPEGLEQAFEAALGGHLNDIVTRDRQVASNLIERLKQERIGRVTFWPLDLDRQRAPEPQIPDRRGVVGRALELLGYPPEVESVLNEILGRTVIMEDLPVALSLYDRCRGRRPHLVTRQGEYLNPSGALTGGVHRHSQSGLLARRREFDKARQDLTDLETRLQQLNAQEEGLQTQRQELEQQANAERERARQLRTELADLEAEQRRRQADRDRTTASLKRLADEQAMIAARQQTSDEELTKLVAREGELEQLRADTEQRLAQHQAEEARLQALREAVNQRLLQAELKLERARQAQLDLERDLQRSQARKSELEADQTAASAEMERCQTARTQLEQEGAELQVQMEQTEAAVQAGSRQLEETRQQNQDLEAQVTRTRQALQACQAQVQGVADRHHAVQVEMARILAHAEEAEARLEELLGSREPPPAPERELQEAELAQIRSKSQRLRHFLENFGSVNLGAREDHDRLSERFADLSTQIKDLEEGAASLKRIMAELDAATVTQFQDAYHRVNETFGRIFTDLFQGGSARLELVDPENWLDSGVEIVACPPGKRLQSLTLLSSGERALSAMAFLLSLLTCKPSPIVILDELDAPLDDSNVERVARRLIEFSSSSQFLVITHNRKTMEFADRLYGVTMEEPGCSRILSVRLTQDGQVEPQTQMEAPANA